VQKLLKSLNQLLWY